MNATDQQPAPLDLNRMRTHFLSEGWDVSDTKDPNVFISHLAGVKFWIKQNGPATTIQTTVAAPRATLDRFDEVLAWAEQANGSSAYPTVAVVPHEPDNLSLVVIAHSLQTFWGYTDQQLADTVVNVLNAIRQTALRFDADFAAN